MIEILAEQSTVQALNDCYAPVLSGSPVLLSAPPGNTPDLHMLRPHPALRVWPLESGYSVVCVPSLSPVVVLNAAGQQWLARLPLGTAAPIATEDITALRVLSRLGLLADSEQATLPVPPERPRALTAWLHTTNACNLRCTYCYLRKNGERMSRATGRAAIDTVIHSARSHGYPEIALKYAGGEATLAMPLVEEMHTYALQQAAFYGLRLQAVLLSNGTHLPPATLHTLQRLGVGLSISLDGLGTAHDIQRPTVSGQDSSGAVLEGIERARAAGVALSVAVTVSRHNIDTLPELTRWLLARELPFTISFHRDNDASHSPAALSASDQHLVEGMRRTYAEVARNPPRWSVPGSLLDRTDASHPHQQHTCGMGEHYLVIDQHGRIAKCQMTIDQPLASVETADPLALIRADQSGVQNLPVDVKSGCQTCEWRYWCAGGCPVATRHASGHEAVQSPNCAVYKALFPDVLRLEGLRLLHWQRAELHTSPTPAHVLHAPAF
jgi:uncharacterized protein